MRQLPVKKILAGVLCAVCVSLNAQDILINDFESSTYGAWTMTGTAFGSGPAAGTLSGQNSVTGYLGNRLVNSFLGGDTSTGTLTSPSFHEPVRFLYSASTVQKNPYTLHQPNIEVMPVPNAEYFRSHDEQ